MIAAEAATYAVLGCVTGCVLGLPLNKIMFQFLIADKWGTTWQLPVASLLLIVMLCFLALWRWGFGGQSKESGNCLLWIP